MSEIVRIDTVQAHNDLFGIETLHPLVTVIDCRKAKPVRYCPKLYGIYAILFKDIDCGELKYGRSIYDYQQGAVLFIAPGQIMGSKDDGELHIPTGRLLSFHPELLRGTVLAKEMKDYSFFSYTANEALRPSEQERKTIIECMEKIQLELNHPIDKHSKKLIVDNIKLLLDYCVRFYDRQFVMREDINQNVLTRFEALLNDYFNSEMPANEGIPTVQYCADKLCLSANYFSDLLRKETGLSALKHIQLKALDVAKERIYSSDKSISEISYDLGFPYPQHFSRWFKKMEGCTPQEYRMRN